MMSLTLLSDRANARPPVPRRAAPAHGLTALFATAFLVFVAATCAPVPDGDQGAPAAVAVTNATIIDGMGGAPVPGGVVVVEGNRIVAAGPATEVAIPVGATIIDAAGGTVMPGLADMHVHMVGGWDGVSTEMLGYRRYLNALLHAGVTTVFDAGNVLPFIQQIQAEIEAGRLPGPRVYMAGPLVDGPVPIWPPSGSPEARITVGNRLTTDRAARSAFLAVGLDPSGPCCESGKDRVNRRESRRLEPGARSGPDRLDLGHPPRPPLARPERVPWSYREGTRIREPEAPSRRGRQDGHSSGPAVAEHLLTSDSGGMHGRCAAEIL